ncbi:MAG: hypothetical protein HYY95_00905 [Candidatus Rokubacteria bacterium]|nr:hypothetical protein [Candidatus Rokubacteria bacterium]
MRNVPRRLTPTTPDAGVVDEDVDPAEGGDDGRDDLVHLGARGHVERPARGRAAARADLRRHAGRALSAAIGHRDGRAVLGQRERDGAADADTAAGRDERDLAAEVHRATGG